MFSPQLFPCLLFSLLLFFLSLSQCDTFVFCHTLHSLFIVGTLYSPLILLHDGYGKSQLGLEVTMPSRQVMLRREPSQQCQRFSHSMNFDLNIRQEAAAFYWDQGESVCPIAGIKGSKESGVNSEPKLLLPALNRSRKEPALQKTKVGSSNSSQQRYEEEVDLFVEAVISLIHLQYSTLMSD